LSIPGLIKTPARVRRFGQIMAVLLRHGWGHLAQRMGVADFLGPAALGRSALEMASTRRAEGITPARRLVLALEELGPSFVKLGQLLATRADILPEDFIVELSKLQDRARPFDSRIARRIVERELDGPISEKFRYFAREPLASGSIAQVYRATLPSGQDVVVKVKRPGIERTIMGDLDLLQVMARQADKLDELKPIRPIMLADEFSRNLRRELDFVTEASFTAKFHTSLRKYRRVRTPHVFWDYTTSNLLTLEELKGISIRRKQELIDMGVDLKRVASDFAAVFMYQYFRTGLFHADPHPGNILVDENGTINIIDFGMAAHLDVELRRQLAMTLVALVRRNTEMIVDIYTDIGAIPDGADLAQLRMDILSIVDKYYDIPLHQIDVQKVVLDMMAMARDHRLILPRDFVLLSKSRVTVVGVAQSLDPEFDLAKAAKPHALAVIADRLSPVNLARGAVMSLWNVNNTLRRMPRDIRTLMRKLQGVLGGDLRLMLSIQEFEGLVPELSRATNRIAFAIIVSGVVIGSSFVIHARIPPFLGALPWVGAYADPASQVSLIGLFGYIFAGVLGLALAWGIWKHGRL